MLGIICRAGGVFLRATKNIVQARALARLSASSTCGGPQERPEQLDQLVNFERLMDHSVRARLAEVHRRLEIRCKTKEPRHLLVPIAPLFRGLERDAERILSQI